MLLRKRQAGTPLSQEEVEQRRAAAKARWEKTQRRQSDIADASVIPTYGAVGGALGFAAHVGADIAETALPDNPEKRIRRALIRRVKGDRASARQVYQAMYREHMSEAERSGGFQASQFFDEPPADAPRPERMARAAERKIYEEAQTRGEDSIDAARAARTKGNSMRRKAGLPEAAEVGEGLSAEARAAAETDARSYARGRLRQFYDFAYGNDVARASKPSALRRAVRAYTKLHPGYSAAAFAVPVAAAGYHSARRISRINGYGETPTRGDKVSTAAALGALGAAWGGGMAVIGRDIRRPVPGFIPVGYRRQLAIVAGSAAAGGGLLGWAGYTAPNRLKDAADKRIAASARINAKRERLKAELAELARLRAGKE